MAKGRTSKGRIKPGYKLTKSGSVVKQARRAKAQRRGKRRARGLFG